MSTFPFPSSVIPLIKETNNLHVSGHSDFYLVFNEARDKKGFFCLFNKDGSMKFNVLIILCSFASYLHCSTAK